MNILDPEGSYLKLGRSMPALHSKHFCIDVFLYSLFTWKSLSEGRLMRLPMESASENAEFDISETLLLRECWNGMLLKDSVR